MQEQAERQDHCQLVILLPCQDDRIFDQLPGCAKIMKPERNHRQSALALCQPPLITDLLEDAPALLDMPGGAAVCERAVGAQCLTEPELLQTEGQCPGIPQVAQHGDALFSAGTGEGNLAIIRQPHAPEVNQCVAKVLPVPDFPCEGYARV